MYQRIIVTGRIELRHSSLEYSPFSGGRKHKKEEELILIAPPLIWAIYNDV